MKSLLHIHPLLYRATLTWFGLFAVAFFNGGFRELFIKKIMGIIDPTANQISCVTGIILLTIFVWLFWKKIKIANMNEAKLIGIYWLAMTLLVETFVLNRLVGKMSWEQILQTYNVALGSWWLFVLIWIGCLPVLMQYFRRIKNQ